MAKKAKKNQQEGKFAEIVYVQRSDDAGETKEGDGTFFIVSEEAGDCRADAPVAVYKRVSVGVVRKTTTTTIELA